VAEVNAQVAGRREPPGRTRNRRRRYDQRIAHAKNTPQLLAAVAEYIRGMFIDYSPAEVQQICDTLAGTADDERRRFRGE
jgi:hypothetical protein